MLCSKNDRCLIEYKWALIIFWAGNLGTQMKEWVISAHFSENRKRVAVLSDTEWERVYDSRFSNLCTQFSYIQILFWVSNHIYTVPSFSLYTPSLIISPLLQPLATTPTASSNSYLSSPPLTTSLLSLNLPQPRPIPHLTQTRQMYRLIITTRLPTRRVTPCLQKQIVISTCGVGAD
jgi:hypothetical protein